MTQTVDLGKIFFDMAKQLPWWVWIILLISILFGSEKERRYQKRRGNYSDQDDQGLLDLMGEYLIGLLSSIFRKNQNISSSHVLEIDRMTGREFEKYLEKLFIKMGYLVNRVGTCWYDHRGDFGADLIVEKDGVKSAVQAKCYHGYVGINSIREVLGALNYYQCQKAIVVTNNYFTNDAQIQAKASNVELWDRVKLLSLISKFTGP